MPNYAGITKGEVVDRIAEHKAEGKRRNIRHEPGRSMYFLKSCPNGREANKWEASMRLSGYVTGSGGISNEYSGKVNCYTFAYD